MHCESIFNAIFATGFTPAQVLNVQLAAVPPAQWSRLCQLLDSTDRCAVRPDVVSYCTAITATSRGRGRQVRGIALKVLVGIRSVRTGS